MSQALGIKTMENVHLLKKYFLPYASCITCSLRYDELKAGSDSQCPDHDHVFTNFHVDQYMIPIILQQFLTDVGTKNAVSVLVKSHSDDRFEEGLNALHAIDVGQIEQSWMEYVDTIPHDLEMIWDTTINGLLRYLQVRFRLVLFFKANSCPAIGFT